jgi:hypothetical protein
MTGFLSRMAARATGGDAGATPRAPSRFESSTSPDAADAMLGRAPSSGPADARPQLSRGSTATSKATQPAMLRGRSAVPDEPEPTVRSVESGASKLSVEPGAARRWVEPGAARGSKDIAPLRNVGRSWRRHDVDSRVVDRREPEPQLSESRMAALVVSAVAAVSAVAPAALQPAPVAEQPANPPQRGPDVVHVSIGRVEVRAPAQPPMPAPSPAARSAGAPERLSLQGYLRGQRDTR